MRITLLVLLLTITSNLYADYGWVYLFKCKVITSDTTIVGFIRGPYEYLSDGTLSLLKKDEKFFESTLIADLKKQTDHETVAISDFAYIHEFSDEKALYVSKNSFHIKVNEIKKLKLYNIVAFHFVPHHVISTLTPQDTVWCKRNPLTRLDDKEIDECCPNAFLIYDDKINYRDVIHKVINEKNSEKRNKLLRELRQYKIIALALCWCG